MDGSSSLSTKKTSVIDFKNSIDNFLLVNKAVNLYQHPLIGYNIK